jgi:hypothetical protein
MVLKTWAFSPATLQSAVDPPPVVDDPPHAARRDIDEAARTPQSLDMT